MLLVALLAPPAPDDAEPPSRCPLPPGLGAPLLPEFAPLPPLLLLLLPVLKTLPAVGPPLLLLLLEPLVTGAWPPLIIESGIKHEQLFPM